MINLAIIGKNFGKNVLFPAFNKIENVNIVGLFSNNWRDVLNSDIQSIAISVPPETQYDILIEAIKLNKHIFCEKPLTIDLNHSNKIIELLENKNIITCVDFELCQSIVIEKLKNIINSKQFGNVISFDLQWYPKISLTRANSKWKQNALNGGGAIGNFTSHILYLLNWLFSEQIEIIKSNIDAQIINNYVEAKIKINNINGSFVVNCNSFNNYFCLNILCENGKLILQNNTDKLSNFSLFSNQDNELKCIIDYIDNSEQDGRIKLVSSLANIFITGIENNTQVEPNIFDGAKIQKLLDILINRSKF